MKGESRGFAANALLMFLALRAGDAVNLAAGMWFVPRYVSANEIGAVLPLSSFATFISLPVFALAMAVMRESAVLSARGERGRVKSLLAGVFVAVAVSMVAVVAVAAVAVPRYLGLMRVSEASVGFLVVVAAFLGCVAPVYTDALQSLKKFRALAAVEVGGAFVRFAAMLVVMPARALAGYHRGKRCRASRQLRREGRAVLDARIHAAPRAFVPRHARLHRRADGGGACRADRPTDVAAVR